MQKKKIGIWMVMVLLLLLVTACAQTEEGQDVEIGEETSLENTNGTPSEDEETPEVEGDSVDSFMHVHGLSYHKKEPYNLYMSTHHGLVQINAANEWKWIGQAENRHDLMGFTIKDEETMISSGHPAEGSTLKDPLGVVISKDQGQTWEPIALYGKVDFHVFEVNTRDSSVVYGINAFGPDAGLYQSLDGGTNWDKLNTNGLPDNLSTIYSLVSNPEDPQSLLVGTQNGILQSTDGGEMWTLQSDARTFTSARAVNQSSGKIVAYLLGENEGLVSSVDFGETWTPLNLVLEQEDAVLHIAIHPTQEDIYTVGTHKEHVLQTTDGGETWTPLAEAGKPVK